MKPGLLGLFLFFPSCAGAEIAVGSSLDWLAVSRAESGEYKLLETADRADPGARWMARLYLLKRTRSLKGVPEKRIRFERSVGLKTPKPQAGRRFLVFFDHHGKTDFIIDLERPGDTASWERAFSNDFREIKGRRKILRAVKERVAHHKANGWPKVDTDNYINGVPGSGYLKLEAPFNSDAHNRLYGGSSVYLVVPADPHYAARLLERTGDGEMTVRAQSAWRLANYHDARTESVLRGLLNDPGTSVLTKAGEGGEEERVAYPVRQAAYRALRAMGVRVDKPQGYDDRYPDSFLE